LRRAGGAGVSSGPGTRIRLASRVVEHPVHAFVVIVALAVIAASAAWLLLLKALVIVGVVGGIVWLLHRRYAVSEASP
jgi:hypothetical protein